MVTVVSALNTVTVFEICSRGYTHIEIQMLLNRTPFSRHLLFLPGVSMLLYHHFGPHHLSHQLDCYLSVVKTCEVSTWYMDLNIN